MSVFARGLAAGSAGTTVLNAVTYLDMALRGRPSSDAPVRTVATLLDRAGQDVPGEGEQRENRIEGLAGISGIATGMGVGLAAGLLAPIVTRLPTAVGATLCGAAAMAATDVTMERLGVSDPRVWSAADWLSDAIPHLAYGLATVWVLNRMR